MPKASTESTRVTKRSSNACERCRRQKIKCSGNRPCERCSKRKLACHFDDYGKKVLVTRGYLASLQDQAAQVSNASLGIDDGVCPSLPQTVNQGSLVAPWNYTPAGGAVCHLSPSPDGVRADGSESTNALNTQDRQHGNDSSESPDINSLTNPLSTGPSTFMLSDTGRTFYLGDSSNWSFTRRILCMTYEHLHRVPLPSTALMFDSKVYLLNWAENSNSVPVLPNLDYAIHLVNIVKFHCNPLFHLFDDGAFISKLHAHYQNADNKTESGDQLWFIHFLLILAFGKAISCRSNSSSEPPGASFFMYAIQLLPNMTILWDEPIQSAEILCCIALYLHCIEHRGSAFNYIGQAVRLAMSHGLHTDLTSNHVQKDLVPRCRKLWWTIHVLDRQMTSLMGLPMSIRDDDVSAPMPDFGGDLARASAFAMRTRLSQFIATIDNAIYRADGRLSSNFLLRTKDTLAGVAGLPDELNEQFPLNLKTKNIGVSRVSAHMHLLFHQCIILATRPVLFSLFKMRLEAPLSYAQAFDSSQVVESLLRMCLDSSQHVVSILECLHAEGLIETFLSYDREALFISMTNLLMAQLLYEGTCPSWTPWYQKGYTVLHDISQCGNLIAQYQESELQQLEKMVNDIPKIDKMNKLTATEASSRVHDQSNMISDSEIALPSPLPDDELGGNYMGAGFSTAQIMDMVSSLDTEHSEWIAQIFSGE